MNKITKSALLFSLIISAGVGFAADTYKNSILDMSMKKELNNTVSLTFYTSKPYNDNVFITKRNANTYVILFPETNSNIKNEISKAEAEGLVQKVDVRTQPYNDQNGKGYTKIILTTPENTTVLAKTEVYKENKPVQQIALDPVQIEKTNPAKQETQNKPLPALPKQETTKTAQKTDKPAQNAQKFDIIKPETITPQASDKKAELPKVIQPEEPAPQPQPEATEENKIATEEVANQNEENNETVAELPPPPQTVKTKGKSELTKFFETKVFWFSASGTLLILFLLIFLNARRKIKDIIGEDGINMNDEVPLKKIVDEIPTNSNNSNKTDDTESKVNLYRLLNATENTEHEEKIANTYSDDLAGMLNIEQTNSDINEPTEEFANANEEDIVFENMVIDEQVQENEPEPEPEPEFAESETEFVLDDIVIDNTDDEEPEEHDLFELSKEEKNENKVEEISHDENISHENSIDDYMKFLAENPEKLELTENSTDIETNDKIIAYNENTEFEDNIADTQPEIIDNSDLNTESTTFDETINDNDFELENEEHILSVYDDISNIQTADFEQTDVNSLFERDAFANDLMQNNDENLVEEEQQKAETDQIEESTDYEEEVENEPIIADESSFLDLSDYKQTVKIHDEVNNYNEVYDDISNQQEQDRSEDIPEVKTEDNAIVLDNGLKVISMVNLKKNAGLYMIDYEGKPSLIGFKNDNYYVLKNFEEAPKKELQARLYDKVGRKEQYLVKLGSEKMIIEFNQKEIKHVMDL